MAEPPRVHHIKDSGAASIKVLVPHKRLNPPGLEGHPPRVASIGVYQYPKQSHFLLSSNSLGFPSGWPPPEDSLRLSKNFHRLQVASLKLVVAVLWLQSGLFTTEPCRAVVCLQT